MPATEKNGKEVDFKYNKIVKRLQIDKKFLKKHTDIIRERFEAAGAEILMGLKSKLENADITGINKCLQLASTILLLGANSDNITVELTNVSNENEKLKIKDIDPSTILTVAILYHLVNRKEKGNGNTKPETIEAIRQRFSKIKWLIGEQWMKKLNIE